MMRNATDAKVETIDVHDNGRGCEAEALAFDDGADFIDPQRALQVIAQHLCRRLPRQVVATLGPAGTSSERAAQYLIDQLPENFGRNMGVELFESFEAAADSVMEGTSDLLVVANAYSAINSFYMTGRLRVLDTFIHMTPDYGVVACNSLTRRSGLRLATHPAVVPMIGDLVPGEYEVVEVVMARSTSDAARMVARGDIDLAITNETSARRHGLRFVSRTRPIRMVWTIFGRNEEAKAAALGRDSIDLARR